MSSKFDYQYEDLSITVVIISDVDEVEPIVKTI